jgi:hypothetical protein
MQACTTISKLKCISLLTILSLSLPGVSFAQPPVGGAIGETAGSQVAPQKKQEDHGLFDQASPYLDYGDFSLTEEENEDTQYFQNGRFFGLSFGGGYQAATGNRGKLYEPALPRFDIRVQYWFNFQFAADLGVFFANHNFLDGTINYEVKLIGYGVHLKYYFDVRDAAAPITFANPYLAFGFGALTKNQISSTQSAPDTDSTLSVAGGGGLEFPISHKRTYLNLELLFHTQNFADTNETRYRAVPDLSGGFFTLLAHFMFTW